VQKPGLGVCAAAVFQALAGSVVGNCDQVDVACCLGALSVCLTAAGKHLIAVEWQGRPAVELNASSDKVASIRQVDGYNKAGVVAAAAAAATAVPAADDVAHAACSQKHLTLHRQMAGLPVPV